MRKTMTAIMILVTAALPSAGRAEGPGASNVSLPEDVVYEAASNGKGPQTAVLFGDPSKPGVFVMRMKFPANMKIMPLTHPDVWRTGVVLSGTLYYGVGEAWEESKLRAYPTGTFFTTATNAPHFVWARDGEVVVQFTAMGPSGTTRIPQ